MTAEWRRASDLAGKCRLFEDFPPACYFPNDFAGSGAASRSAGFGDQKKTVIDSGEAGLNNGATKEF
jgi:hypothetical protein